MFPSKPLAVRATKITISACHAIALAKAGGENAIRSGFFREQMVRDAIPGVVHPDKK